MTLAGVFDPEHTTDGNAALGSNTTTSRVHGTAVGPDYRFSPFTLAGFCTGRRRHQFFGSERSAPTCSRREHSCATPSDQSISQRRRQSRQQSRTLNRKSPANQRDFLLREERHSANACLLRVCSSSNRSVRLCLLNHPALSRAFHAKRRSTANCEPLSFHCS
jgi:hypothetical protein